MLDFQLKQSGHNSKLSPKDIKGAYQLEDILKNKSLYKKYPQLKDINVIFADFHTPKKRGLKVGDDIFINSKLYNKDKTKLQSTIVHEIEHAKQNIKKMSSNKEFDNYMERYNGDREIGARKKQDEFISQINKAQ
jgi:hypothetical protein